MFHFLLYIELKPSFEENAAGVNYRTPEARGVRRIEQSPSPAHPLDIELENRFVRPQARDHIGGKNRAHVVDGHVKHIRPMRHMFATCLLWMACKPSGLQCSLGCAHGGFHEDGDSAPI